MQANADLDTMLIAERVLPVKGEDSKRGIYMKASLADAELLNADAQPRESGADYQRINRKYGVDVYDAQEYGLESVIDDSYEEEVDRFMNLEATEAALLERSLKLSYEKRVAALIQNATTFTATASTVNYTAANLNTIDVCSDVDLAKARMLLNGIIPNAVIMSFNVYQRIRRSTLLQNQIYGVVPRAAGQKMLPGEASVAEALGIDNLYVAKCPYNVNAKGQVYAGSFIWNDTYFAVAQIKGGEYTAGGVGRTIQWTKDTTGLFTPETYRDDKIRSNVLRVRQHTSEKIIDTTCCALVTTSYA
jgi:hypothetical protein